MMYGSRWLVKSMYIWLSIVVMKSCAQVCSQWMKTIMFDQICFHYLFIVQGLMKFITIGELWISNGKLFLMVPCVACQRKWKLTFKIPLLLQLLLKEHLVDWMEDFHAVESISCRIKAFIWEAEVGGCPAHEADIHIHISFYDPDWMWS